MELFNRRYFCFISFVFALLALLCTLFDGTVKLIIAGTAVLALIGTMIFFIKSKKRRFESLFAIFLCLAVSVSALSSYFFISKAEEEANSLLGENAVLVRVIAQTDKEEYSVRLLRVGDKDVDIKSELHYDFAESLEYGDELIVIADIERANDIYDRAKLIRLTAKGEDSYLNRAESKNYFSIDGILSLCHSLREVFSEYVDGVFEDYGALVKGLLVNDKSDIDARTNVNFRRSGTSHILAVSGMHITLLMGALELLLRVFEVKKEIRIVIVSLFAIFFLALTAFVASAVRSVIMLFAVYLSYILCEENDSITALFASVAIIILFSPYSVYDLGMWMSFLATLGILLVYFEFDNVMPYPKQENLIVRYTLRALIWCAKALVLTIVSNFFLLPIMWLFFGEFSISTIPCNLILGPIVTVLMPLCALATLFGRIPYLGALLVFLTKRMIDLMMLIVDYFAEMRFGVVSLSYGFAGILIALFTVIFVIMLVIKLKHKLVIFAPMVAFVVAFIACFSVFSATARPKIVYYNLLKNELVFVNYGAECSVISYGEANSLTAGCVVNNMSKYATEIDEYFIINPSKYDYETIESVSKNTVIRKIYIPKSLEYQEYIYCYDILKCAEKYNILVELYDNGESVEICNKISLNCDESGEVSIGSDIAALKLLGDEAIYNYAERSRSFPKNKSVMITLPLD